MTPVATIATAQRGFKGIALCIGVQSGVRLSASDVRAPAQELPVMHELCIRNGADAFPLRLVGIPDPPASIWVRGAPSHLPALDEPSIAVVGSRSATRDGLEVATRIASGLARAGVVVVSGLARGIDAAAHQAALDAHGRTIAVLGSGLRRLYPPEHDELASGQESTIAEVTEYVPTCRSPRRVLRDRVAHCIEGAMLAAAALRVQGLPPLILDLEAARDDDHLLALFRHEGFWGAVAKSNYSGLRFRDPVFRNIRELVLSYYELYYNLEGETSLSAYSRPVNLTRFDRIGWMTAEEDLWEINDYLCAIPHTPVRPPGLHRRRLRVDKRLYEAGLLGSIQS